MTSEIDARLAFHFRRRRDSSRHKGRKQK
jgi:hypothetical protein